MIIVVSDVHLGYARSNASAFYRFLDQCGRSNDLDQLVLLGDILDFWRTKDANIIEDGLYSNILNRLACMESKKIRYVVGNHDYNLLKYLDRHKYSVPFNVSKNYRLEYDGEKYYFTHGYELEVLANLKHFNVHEYEKFSELMCWNNDLTGAIASKAWDWLNAHKASGKFHLLKRPPEERKIIDKVYDFAMNVEKHMILDMKPEEMLVYGHTHMPYISSDGTVANTGSWVNETSVGMGKSSQNHYITISEGQMELRTFEVDPFP
jgi:UDP-2,3-diacylglucosamine pyrophosphatase LpxH